MSKIITAIIFVAITIGLGCWAYQSISIVEEDLVIDLLNATYIIEGDRYTLVDGVVSREVISGSDSGILVSVFDAATQRDVNGDDLDDVAVLLAYDKGESEIFFYIALAIQQEQGYKVTNTLFVGERITPQTIRIIDGEIIVNYTDRYPWEDFTTRPLVGKSKYLVYENGELKRKQREVLSQEMAESLVIEKWGDCGINECSLVVSILDDGDGIWYVQAVYDELKDDSVKTQKRIASIPYVDEEWSWGSELVQEYKCQPGRGHQDFSEELCL